MWSSSSRQNVIWERTDLFIFVKSLILGSLNVLCPGKEDKANEDKMGSQTSFTMLPWMQFAFKGILSTPVMLIGLLLLCDHAMIWKNPAISSSG